MPEDHRPKSWKRLDELPGVITQRVLDENTIDQSATMADVEAAFKGATFADCPGDFLDAMANALEYFATKNAADDPKKAGYERLDANWSQLHDLGIDTFRAALEMPEATIPEMVEAIARLRHPATEEPLAVFWDDDSVYVVARSAEDATLVYAEHVGYCMSHETLQFSRFSDSDSIRIKCYGLDHPASGRIAPVDEAGPHIVLVTRPAIEWAHRIGRGFLCTTDY